MLQKCALFANMPLHPGQICPHEITLPIINRPNILTTAVIRWQHDVLAAPQTCCLCCAVAEMATRSQRRGLRSCCCHPGEGTTIREVRLLNTWLLQLDGATRGLKKEKVESKLPISVSLLPETSPVIDFHIKQTVALTLFPDIAQSAYWLWWAARHHRCILNHPELN